MVRSTSFRNLGFRLDSSSLRFAGTLTRRTGKRWNPRLLIPRDVNESTTDIATLHPDQLSQLEAVLFLASQPLPSRKLAQLVHLTDGTAARTLVKELNALYAQRNRSFRVEEVAGGYQLRTRKIFAPWIRKIISVPQEVRMSGPAMETLAVVAYRQPVMRTEIEKVRGVQCGEILRQLMERGMVRISGRADELGRPFLYGTTRNFLETFGLRSLDELPRASMLRTTGEILEDEPKMEQGKEVSVCDATGGSSGSDGEYTLENVPVTTMEKDVDDDLSDDDEEHEDGDYEDDYEDDEFETEEEEESDEDDGFSDEEWEEVKDDDDDEDDDDEDWEDDEDTWDDDEDWEDDD